MANKAPIVGLRWKVVINGKRALNGETYSVTYTGDVAAADREHNIYDLIRQLTDEVEEKNGDMEILESIQVTIA